MGAQAVRESSRIATSTVAYAEARSAFARLRREGILSEEEEHRRIVVTLDERWPSYDRLAASDHIARLTGALAEQYALRGFDALHLASAVLTHASRGNAKFLSFDNDLTRAAGQMIPVYEPEAR